MIRQPRPDNPRPLSIQISFRVPTRRVNLLNDTQGEHTFTVDLPHQRKVVDVGTEFGLIVDNAQHAQVHVFDGIVDYKRLDDKGEVVGQLRLNENEQIESTPEGEVTPFMTLNMKMAAIPFLKQIGIP